MAEIIDFKERVNKKKGPALKLVDNDCPFRKFMILMFDFLNEEIRDHWLDCDDELRNEVKWFSKDVSDYLEVIDFAYKKDIDGIIAKGKKMDTFTRTIVWQKAEEAGLGRAKPYGEK